MDDNQRDYDTGLVLSMASLCKYCGAPPVHAACHNQFLAEWCCSDLSNAHHWLQHAYKCSPSGCDDARMMLTALRVACASLQMTVAAPLLQQIHKVLVELEFTSERARASVVTQVRFTFASCRALPSAQVRHCLSSSECGRGPVCSCSGTLHMLTIVGASPSPRCHDAGQFV